MLTSTAGTIDQATLVSRSVIRAADILGLSMAALSTILGISETSVWRMRRGEYMLKPDTEPFDIGILFVRLFRSLDAITNGDKEVADTWLRVHSDTFEGAPLEKMKSMSGLTDVIAYLEARGALA